MVRAEFHEREYEIAMAVELVSGRVGEIFSPGQVIEAVVGFDAAASVDPAHVIWEVLNAPRPPGIHLVPHLWYPGPVPGDRQLPSFPISLMLQYKRPEFLLGGAAAQWRLWRRPYYRFQREQRQHAVLVRLARGLGADAVVRYAAPAFHTRAELEARQASREVVASSGYVDPMRFGRHKVWTYEQPGLVGYFNPDARAVDFETSEALSSLLEGGGSQQPTRTPARKSNWREHLARVGQIARVREPALRRDLSDWRSTLKDLRVHLGEETIEAIVDVASIASVMSRGSGDWFLAGGRSVAV